MEAEALAKLVDLAQQAARVQEIRPAGEPAHVYLLRDPVTATLTRHEAEPQPRQNQAYDLPTVVRCAVEHATPEQDVEVWYSRSGVVCYLNAAERRDRVGVALQRSPQLESLVKQAGKLLAQKQFVRHLAVELYGCVPDQLVAAVRSLKFRIGEQGEATVQHGKASLGRSIEAELRGETSIPERVLLCLPVFDGHPDRYAVECAVEIEAEQKTLALTPMPGQVESALRAAEADLGDRLAALLRVARGVPEGESYDEPVSLYYGVP